MFVLEISDFLVLGSMPRLYSLTPSKIPRPHVNVASVGTPDSKFHSLVTLTLAHIHTHTHP